MKYKNRFLAILVKAFALPVIVLLLLSMSGVDKKTVPSRPEGPCDIYAAAGNPCVAAHSTTRALYASYNGPLYQIMRQSDGKTLDIGVVQPSDGDPGGYADAAAQDAFCANTYCWVTKIYDQSGKGNHLIQAPRGGFSGPAMGGFNNLPIADMAPVTIMGHKVYGIFIAPGMGLRLNDTKGTAVDDQAEGQYWVINGHHFNNGCCYDYGNAETDSRDDGDGTMETTYYGNANYWYHGQDAGPWIMTDQENNLVGCVNASPNDKYCVDLASVTWRFVTAMADGEPHHWRSMGGDAQHGDLEVMFDGSRVTNERNSYDPMRKQGAILLGNGGDNSNGSQGTFYEGAMTAPGTFPSKETNQKVQANIVAAKYDVQRLSIAPANTTDTPPGVQTFSPQSTQNTTVTFTNTTGDPVNDLSLNIDLPIGWKSVVLNTNEISKKFSDPVLPGTTVKATFSITSGNEAFNGDITGKASWTNPKTNKTQSDIVVEKVRNVSPVKINEFRISDGSPENSTNSFIELYNAGNTTADISNWTLTQHQTQMSIFSSIQIPTGTKLAAHSYYLLGLSTSGLAAPAKKGESTIYVRSTIGMSTGDRIEIGTGSAGETRKIVSITTPPEPEQPTMPFRRRNVPGSPTTIWQPLPEGPVITIPAGSKNIPVTSIDGFEVGQKMAIGYGATYPSVAQSIEKYEIVTITKVGKPGTQAYLSMNAKAGDKNIKVSSIENISVGDKIRLDIDSKGHGIEIVTVKQVGTKSSRNTLDGPLKAGEDPGTGLELEKPLKFNHSSNIPFSVNGTGISFEPATAFSHSSNEPVLPLCFIVVLDQPLSGNHHIDAVVNNPNAKTAGYQGTHIPDQLFGGPALSSNAGNMVLRDAAGNVVDALNYGGLVDPWAAEGYQAVSGAGANGCYASSPSAGRGFMWWLPSATFQPNRSAGRYPDGADNDNNGSDFKIQNTTTLALPSNAGTNNIKVNSVEDFSLGQKIIIDAGTNSETAVIAAIGTPGGTSVGTSTTAGATAIPVGGLDGFNPGQTITIDGGANRETAVIASVVSGRRWFGRPNNGPTDTIKVTTPLTKTHNVGVQVSGSGITLATPLNKSHENKIPIAGNVPTPGEPNQYFKKP
jgi:non-reducing end alpha-L-arabinofuranosidase